MKHAKRFFNWLCSWLLSNKPNNLLTIILVLIPAIASYWVSNDKIDKLSTSINTQISNINQQIQAQSQTQTQSQSPTFNNTQNVESAKDEKGKVEGSGVNKSFSLEDWNLVADVSVDSEGYFCPNIVPFPSWFMWTKNKYKADRPISITFHLMDKTSANGKNPTLFFSYGDKSNNAPDTYYRINILDGDLNTLRLLGKKEVILKSDRSLNEISITDFLTFKIAPVFPRSSSSRLNINPSISYPINGTTITYAPPSDKDFMVNLPFPSKDDQGDGAQYGIGVSKGDCFRVISYEL